MDKDDVVLFEYQLRNLKFALKYNSNDFRQLRVLQD